MTFAMQRLKRNPGFEIHRKLAPFRHFAFLRYLEELDNTLTICPIFWDHLTGTLDGELEYPAVLVGECG